MISRYLRCRVLCRWGIQSIRASLFIARTLSMLWMLELEIKSCSQVKINREATCSLHKRITTIFSTETTPSSTALLSVKTIFPSVNFQSWMFPTVSRSFQTISKKAYLHHVIIKNPTEIVNSNSANSKILLQQHIWHSSLKASIITNQRVKLIWWQIKRQDGTSQRTSPKQFIRGEQSTWNSKTNHRI